MTETDDRAKGDRCPCCEKPFRTEGRWEPGVCCKREFPEGSIAGCEREGKELALARLAAERARVAETSRLVEQLSAVLGRT